MKKILIHFFQKNKDNYKSYGEQIVKKYRLMNEHGSLDLNKDINYLNAVFGNNSFLEVELFWNYSLCRFFIDNDKTKIFEKKNVIQTFIKKFAEIKNKIATENGLPLYDKFRTIYTLFTILFMKSEQFQEVDEIENLNIRYVITSKKKNNSIMDKAYKFYNKVVDSITEDSAIFPYLLYVYGGYGYYKKDDVYTFDLKNLDMLKTHLKQTFPKVIIFCYINNGEEALTESEFGGIVLNEFYITEKKFIDYNTDKLIDITEEEKDDIAMSLFLYLFHEVSGHKKYALLLEILRKMKNKGKLINYPELFSDNGKKLNEYASLRKQIEENNIKTNFKYNISIDHEIKQMKNELEKINQSNPNNKIEIFKEQILTKDKMNKNILLNKGKRNRNDINLEKESNEKKFLTMEERLNYAIKRVGEKFNIYPGPLWKQNLIKIKKEISINDPYYYDISLLLRECYIKF